MAEFANMVARVESIPLASLALSGCSARDFVRSRQVEGERHPVAGGAGVNGLFESLLSQSFGAN